MRPKRSDAAEPDFLGSVPSPRGPTVRMRVTSLHPPSLCPVQRVAPLFFALTAAGTGFADTPIPHLRQQGTATQLIVDGRPFLVRGGEVNNSSATNPAYLAPHWPKFRELNLNTLIAPVYWNRIEAQEGHFEFSTVDVLLRQARENRMRIVLLWFGSWKNSMSCYAPNWIKLDPKRFPRADDGDGNHQEILSAFAPENLLADTAAFSALMRHLRETDSADHTVVMVQVENEIGMIPAPRDHGAAADRAFAGSVPADLLSSLSAHSGQLQPQLRGEWSASSGKHGGTWSEVFGHTPAGEEIFTAWYYARYTEAVAAAGKKEYPLPMYVNAALIRPGYQPGQYPSGGPLPHLMDIWRAAAPSIDFLSPDIYFQDFASWARRYKLPGNPLFIPEASRGPEASVNCLYVLGALDAIGFSPFGIDTIGEAPSRYLSESFDLVAQLEPLLLASQGRGISAGLLPEGPEQRQPQRVTLGGYVLNVSFERGAPPAPAEGAIAPANPPDAQAPPPSGGLVIATGADEFVFAGTAFVVTFESSRPKLAAGILSAEEGHYVDGAWRNTLWLGGDQTHQGRHVRLEAGRFSIQRVKLYRY